MEQLDFVVEWPLREIHWTQLQPWNNEGHLSAQQQTRLSELDRLIERHQAAVDLLLAE